MPIATVGFGTDATSAKINEIISKVNDHDTALSPLTTLLGVLNLATASYTPTLSGMAIGTGGSAANTADYIWLGGPDVADKGLLIAWGRVVFGTSGQTFPTSATIALPSGFNFASTVARNVGSALLSDSSASTANRYRMIRVSAAGTFQPLAADDGATIAALTTTTPFTWAAGDSIDWQVLAPGVRV